MSYHHFSQKIRISFDLDLCMEVKHMIHMLEVPPDVTLSQLEQYWNTYLQKKGISIFQLKNAFLLVKDYNKEKGNAHALIVCNYSLIYADELIYRMKSQRSKVHPPPNVISL